MKEKKKHIYPIHDVNNPEHKIPVEIPDELYWAISPEIWRTRKRMQKLGQCVCPKSEIWTCDGICQSCEYQASGNQISIDAPVESADGPTIADTISDDSPSPESIAIYQDLLDALWQELDALNPEERRMVDLYMEGHSEREISNILNMPRSTFKRHWSKILALLKDNLADYYI